MLKNILIVILLAAFMNFTFGCHYAAKTKPEALKGSKETIVKIALLDGRTIQFDDEGGHYFASSKQISGFAEVKDSTRYHGRLLGTKGFVPVNVPIDSVLQVWVKRTDPIGTLFAVIGVVALVGVLTVLVIAALKESCPFVYSYDGHQFVFDAEPLGGAICEGLQRSDCSRLEHVKPVEGQYRLKFKNEVEETQYLDGAELLVVDHQPEDLIVPDTAGYLHVISEPISAEKAVDENGRDITSFVNGRDGMAWQTQMSEKEVAQSTDTRHHLTFEFSKPQNAQRARLIVNAGTAIWGSNMIREMLQLRGSRVDEWYRAVNQRGLKALELLSFNLREELYLMKLYVQKDSTFVERSLVLGGGPFVAEDRVIELDVSDIPGDKLVLQVNPPKGFWTLDYLAVDFDHNDVAAPQVVKPLYARDLNGQDITRQLTRIDSVRYVMARIGDWADITFDAPPLKADLQRSVFLKTTGYYEVQIDKSVPEQTELVNRLLREPGAIASYSMQRYLEWLHSQNRSN